MVIPFVSVQSKANTNVPNSGLHIKIQLQIYVSDITISLQAEEEQITGNLTFWAKYPCYALACKYTFNIITDEEKQNGNSGD